MEKNSNRFFIFDRPIKYDFKYLLRYLKMQFLRAIYHCLFGVLYPKDMHEKKYFVSICAIFKNEGKYLKEWIEFHRIVGVEHFYLYNNNSTDNYKEVLQNYIETGIVTLIEWPGEQQQMTVYKDCILKYRNESQWVGFLDLDEFVCPNQDDNFSTFLKRFTKRPVVLLYWKMFCTSGLFSRDTDNPIIEDFKICWEKYDNIGKCFFNTSYDFRPDVPINRLFNHYMYGSYKGILLPPVNSFNKICIKGFNPVANKENPVQLNHYFTKSYSEFLGKCARGDAFFAKNPRDFEYFYKHERLCNSIDLNIYKYLIKLKLSLMENE